jgi:hypothetical protein
MELEAEERWLRKLIMRLRTILRYASDSRAEVGLREAISDAENRLELLQATSRKPFQQQQQVPPGKTTAQRLSLSKKRISLTAELTKGGP